MDMYASKGPRTHAMSPPLRGCAATDNVYQNHGELPASVQILHEGLNGQCSLEAARVKILILAPLTGRRVIIGRASSV
jgi:hypothetical protein